MHILEMLGELNTPIGLSIWDCTCLTLIVISVSEWKKKNYERHFPVKWWPFERLNGLYKLRV